MIGAPGETPETIAESLALLDNYAIPLRTWVTVGICLWTHRQQILEEARRDGQFWDDEELFEGANYTSPELPKDYMIGLIKILKTQKEYTVQVNKPYAESIHRDSIVSHVTSSRCALGPILPLPRSTRAKL